MNTASNIVLVGPMGSGKSAVGRALAARLGLPFVDADEAIVDSAGMDIPAIFATEGEAGFRARERSVLATLLADGPRVIATGGGAVLDAGTRAALRKARTLWLQVEAAEQLRRIGNDGNRPLLAAGDRAARLAELSARREPLYREVAEFAFDTTGLAPEDAAAALAGLLPQCRERRA